MTVKTSKSFSRITHWIGLVFILCIFLAVNTISYKRYFRKDYSVNRYLNLSEQTINLLKTLPSEITIIDFNSAQSDPVSALIDDDVKSLIDEYKYYSHGKIITRTVNPFTDMEAAEKTAQQFKLTRNESVLIIQKGDQSKIIKFTDMADVDSMGMMFGQPPKVKAFKGESTLTGALLELIQGKKFKVYFTKGHGESEITGSDEMPYSISILAARLKGQNIEPKSINLAEEGRVPEDANALIVFGPKAPFTSIEINLLKNYLENKGRLFISLPPLAATGLEDILQPYGVTFNNDLVLKKMLAISQGGGLTPTIRPQAIGNKYHDHPAVSWASQMNVNIPLGMSRSISIKALETQNAPDVTSLIESAAKDWGETDLKDTQKKEPEFDAKTDHPGPLNLAVSIDATSVSDGHVRLPGTRVIAMGSADFINNKEIGIYQADLFINMLNWLIEQKQALGITAKTPQEFTLVLTDSQVSTMTWIIILGIPAIILAIGIIVWIKRRK